jgi:surfeit locus 1 family protein
MNATSAPTRNILGFGIFTLVMLMLFTGLGIWQLQRRTWKHALIAALTERLAEAPAPLPPPSQWGALKPAQDEFRRVRFSATYEDVPDAMVKPLLTNTPVTLTGYLRFPEKAGMLTPAENLSKRLWFTRDHLAMAHALGWGADGRPVAPFYVDLESPVPAGGVPTPGPLEVHLKDDHMQYAITWFGLAGAMVIAFGAWWRTQVRSA